MRRRHCRDRERNCEVYTPYPTIPSKAKQRRSDQINRWGERWMDIHALTPAPDAVPPATPILDAELGFEVAAFAACLSPADMTLAVASGFLTIARCMADAAAPCTPCIGFELESGIGGVALAEANISGRAEKYLKGTRGEKG